MFRSPISPASFCTLARSSSRSAISSGDSGAAFGILLPGILIPNHQSNAKTAATAITTRTVPKKIRLNTLTTESIAPRTTGGTRALSNLFAESHRAKRKQSDAHPRQDEERRPEVGEACSAQHDRSHQRDEISRGHACTDPIENPGHRFPRKNETREKDSRQKENERQLKCFHLRLRPS